MELTEKNIDLEFNDSFMTLGLNTFLSILFENITEEVNYYKEVSCLNDKLKLIEKVLELANDDKEYLSINLNLDKNLLKAFSLGLLARAKNLCDYAL